MKSPVGNRSAFVVARIAISLGIVAIQLQAADWPQWRGPQRNGISQETGLLQTWPKDGPKLLWQRTDIGTGYATPAVVGARVYLLSNEGPDNEFVQALEVMDGRRVWQRRLGKVGNPEQKPSYPGARSTPTVDGDILFALGSDGDLACVEIADGKIRWQKNLRTDFGGKPGIWAYSESPLVDGDALICTPGGSSATLVALNKKTGAVIWKSAVPGGDAAAYASAGVTEAAGVKQYVQVLDQGLVGVDAKSGKFLWRYNKVVSPYKANIPTPLVQGDLIYTSGAGKGGALVKLKAADGGAAASEVYFSPKLPTTIGGVVKRGEFFYGTTARTMVCIEFATGNVKWEDPAMGPASLFYADGNFYVHTEEGDALLVAATPDGYREKGRFTPPGQPKHTIQMEKSWAYPVVSDGRLYLRDHGVLWCYDVKAAK